MTLLDDTRTKRPPTRDYELLRPKAHTRLYGYRAEDKDSGLAITRPGAMPPLSEIVGPATSGTSATDFDEGVLIGRGSGATIRPKRDRRIRNRLLLRKRPRGRLKNPVKLGGSASPRDNDRKLPTRLSPPAVVREYKGLVESVHEGLAYLALESPSGQRFHIEWDAEELARRGIGERQPFILNTIAEEGALKFEFIPDRLHSLRDELQVEIDALMAHYRKTGQFDDACE